MIIGVLADERVEEIVKIFAEVFFTNARAGGTIDIESVSVDLIINCVSGIVVELLIDVLVASMTTL